jgi:membrane protease YdiL (CAAX protease family)
MRQLQPTHQPPLSRGLAVIGFYAALGLGALLLSSGRGDPDLYRLRDSVAPWWLLLSPAVGLGFALLVVALTRVATRRYGWAKDLHQSFRDLLGPLSDRDIAIVALASALGEELLFRGALQPWIGVGPQAVVFALLHLGPGRRFLPWTLSALVMGAALGLMAEYTGNLGGPIVAHFTINFFNLRFITRR